MQFLDSVISHFFPGQFQDRLQFGVQRELIDLCRLTSLNGQRARVLFNAGIDSIAILANTNIADVEILLGNCAPFERYHSYITLTLLGGEGAKMVFCYQNCSVLL